MDIQNAYNSWARQYDSNQNKTRDLEALALRSLLTGKEFMAGLEIGCGTGKNTSWLQTICLRLVAVDLSEEMLSIAKEKIQDKRVEFHQADITETWTFANELFDLVTFSLVLEHIEDLEPVMAKAAGCMHSGAALYIGELHPYKQYAGSKARFDTAEGRHILTCFNHSISEFTQAAKKAGLEISDIREFYDEDDRNTIPRILGMVLRKR